MSEHILVCRVTDAGDVLVFEDWETAIEHIRQGLLSEMHPPCDGDEYHIEFALMRRAEYDALPEE